MNFNSHLIKFEYSDYLETWEDRFDGQENGNESYFSFSLDKEIHYVVYRLSLSQFQDHIKKLKENWDAFDRAYNKSDAEGMNRSLEKALPHELVLLC